MTDAKPSMSDSAPGLPSQRPAIRPRGFWLPAVLAAIGVHAVAFAMFGVASGHREPHRVPPRGVRWVGERADEAIDVRDPKPIFLPTWWNAATREASQTDSRGPGEIFGLEEKPPLVAAGTSPTGLVVLPEGVRTAGVAIRRFARPYFSAFGQEDSLLHRLPVRAASIEVRAATSGELVYQRELALAETTAAGADARRWPFWAPFEMLLTVEPTGTLGPPLVSAPGSGAGVVDDFFRSVLRSVLRPDLVLPAGYYRVVIGP